MKIKDQTAIVTGGGSGLGKACVDLLLQKGANVAVWDKSFSAQAEPDPRCLFISCDVRSEKDIEAALDKTQQHLGSPRISIHCAGIAPAKKILGRDGPMPLADFQSVLTVNLIGTFNVLRLVGHAMSSLALEESSEERGVMINTASIAAFEGQIGQSAYSASKGGVVALTLPAAREFARHAIRVNTIAPGLMETPLLLNMPQEVQDHLKEDLVFPKRFGRPSEFSTLAIHLIENTLINGAVIRLDAALRMAPA